MRLRVLGSGTSAGGTDRNCSGYLVDDSILLDCGPGIWRALDDIGHNLQLIDKIFISHFHVDHVSDLISILWSRYVLKFGQEKRLSIFGPPSTRTWFRKSTRVYREWINKLHVEIHELLNGQLVLDGYSIQTSPTLHGQNSICFRIADSSNSSLFYSGDSGWSENLIHLANSCNLAIIEASISSRKQAVEHLSPQLAARIAHCADAQMLLLTHMYPDALGHDPVTEAKREYNGEIAVAFDGFTINL